jgi:hypothetical protein
MGLLGNLNFSVGMKGIDPDQELWRFLDLWKANDLFHTQELYMRQVALLRSVDPRESKLPNVIRETFRRRKQVNLELQRFIEEMLDVAENQATSVYASCWYMPNPLVDSGRMWHDFGGGERGGVCVITTIRRLGQALLDDRFEIGAIRYIEAEISFREAFNLNQYRSFPFLLKLVDHEPERELRLFKRFRRPPQPDCLRPKVDLQALIKNIRISPLLNDEQDRRLRALFIDNGMPADLFLLRS